MTTLSWKIFYGDGTTFDSSMGSPKQAPSDNVQIILSHEPTVGRACSYKYDWYYSKTDETWWGCDVFGLIDQVKNNLSEISSVKQGRTIDSIKYKEILEKALNDSDIPPAKGASDWAIKTDRKPGQRW